jgi:hypothetical protein
MARLSISFYSTMSRQTRDNRFVALVTSGLVNQRRIAAGVERAAKALSADVVRIRYDIGSDWTDNPAVFFKIILTDKASRPANLRDVIQRVSLKIGNEARIDETGLHAYFSFRSQSEQAKLKESEWD